MTFQEFITGIKDFFASEKDPADVEFDLEKTLDRIDSEYGLSAEITESAHSTEEEVAAEKESFSMSWQNEEDTHEIIVEEGTEEYHYNIEKCKNEEIEADFLNVPPEEIPSTIHMLIDTE